MLEILLTAWDFDFQNSMAVSRVFGNTFLGLSSISLRLVTTYLDRETRIIA